MFKPFPGKIEIEPIDNQGLILAHEKYEEVGKVIQVSKKHWWSRSEFKPGDIVFFLAYGVEQTPEYEGKVHYVVPCNDKFVIGKYVP